MSEHLDWTPFDPDAPPGLSDLEGAGRVVGIVATEAGHEAGWAVECAVQAAASWSAGGVRLILADGALSDPKLHTAVGIENNEGVSDALVFGASIRRVAQKVEGHGYFAVSAGTVVADAGQAVAEGRWAHLCAAFRDAGVTLAVYLPAGEAATATALQEASHVVVVAAQGEPVPEVVAECDAVILGVVGPEGVTVEAASDEPVAGMDGVVDVDAGLDVDGAAETDVDPGFDGGFDVDETADMDVDLGLEGGLDVHAAADDDAVSDDLAVPGDDWSFDTVDVVGEEEEPATEVPDDLPDDLTDELPEDAALAADLPQPLHDAGSDEPGEELPHDVVADVPVGGPDSEDVIFQRALAAAETPEASREEVAHLEEILEESRSAAPPSRRRNVLLLILLLVVLGLLTAGWLGYVEIPGITPEGGSAATVPVAAEGAATVPVAAARSPEATSAPLPVSLAVGAFSSLSAARSVVEEVRETHPDLLLLVEPIVVDGRVLHRVLAGAVADSAQALQLVDRLVTEGQPEATSWGLRDTPLAFQLGEMDDLEAAERRVEVLEGLDVPAYVLAVEYDDATVHYRVYAGAYADAAEASALQELLTQRGLSAANLSPRKGRLP